MAVYNPTYLKWLNVIAFVLTVIVNSLAGSTTLIGGVNTAQVSDANPTLITPAGYVFAIWGIIYILLAVFVIYQVRPSQKDKDYHRRIGWLFVLSCLANILWLFTWQYAQLGLSVLLMILLLFSLIMIYLRLDIGRSSAPRNEKLAVHLPFSVYLGWITIATIADISATLVSLNWDGLGISQTAWAILIVIVALLITMLMIAIRKDVAYSLVIVWALVGISAKQSAYPDVALATQVGAILVLIALVLTILVWPRMRKSVAKSSEQSTP